MEYQRIGKTKMIKSHDTGRMVITTKHATVYSYRDNLAIAIDTPFFEEPIKEQSTVIRIVLAGSGREVFFWFESDN